MRRASLGLFFILLATSASAQIVPPAPGVEAPEALQMSGKGPDAFQFKRAWIDKAHRIRDARARFVDSRGFYNPDLVSSVVRPQLTVSGTFSVPVFCVKYSDTGAEPFTTASFQTRLFDGPFAPQTLSEYYDEISYGDLAMTGTVYGWTTLPNTGAYYAGPGGCDGLCGGAHVGQLIVSTLNGADATVDFGLYDNDGPDGAPNSGDDDGFVDFAAFVHPTQGAECGAAGKIWSHRWVLSGWTGTPYTTNDPRTGGGSIRVDDYVIMPASNCGGTTQIDIGVFCHEFGHALGLPDLYDTDGGSEGVGHWCLMGSGNWNSPQRPAHMSAWSKNQLGWSNLVVVDAVPADYDVHNAETNRTIYRLDVMHERWRRMSNCAISGSHSMGCALNIDEASARLWAGAGYGNRWDETFSRDFVYDGSGSVTLTYQYAYELEPGFDFVHGQVTVGGTTSTFASYTNAASGTANIDLTPYLGGGPTPYRISFRMTSDGSVSDEDGQYATTCGAIALDDIGVVGGGENYFTDFESREDGWAQDMTAPNEHFLVENRQPIGSDANVWGGGGLAIWHIDTADQGGGPDNDRPRGVAFVQADGDFDLEADLNRGDAGDAFPGDTDNQLFDGGTTPNSDGNGAPSTASVALLTGNADPISATMVGGWPAPVVSQGTPNAGLSGATVQVQIDGAGFAKGGTAELVLGAATIAAASVEWVGKDRVLANFDLTGAANGAYDLVAFNPGGASAAAAGAFTVSGATTSVGDPQPARFALRPNYPNPFHPSTTIRFDIGTRAHVTLQVYDVSGALVRTLVNRVAEPRSYSVTWDGRDEGGHRAGSGVYFYRLTAADFSDVRRMTLMK